MLYGTYAMYMIYRVILIVSAPSVCVLTWLALGQARDRHLDGYLHWLRPLAVSTSFTLGSVFVFAVSSLLYQGGGLAAVLVYGLSACAAPFAIVSAYRLWRMLRSLPPSRGELPGEDMEVEGVWPPPPSR